MNYQAIIFDLDGVICSTDEYHYQAWKKMADGMGIPFDRTINNRLRGYPAWRAWRSSWSSTTAPP